MKILFWHLFLDKTPFAVKDSNGNKQYYNRDGIKKLGKKYDDAASKAIISMEPQIIEGEE